MATRRPSDDAQLPGAVDEAKAARHGEMLAARVKKTFKKHAGRPLRFLREDFCGTAALCAEWVKEHPENRAMGIDYHEPTLNWGREHIMPLLDEDQRNRIELICDDVRHVTNALATASVQSR